MKKYLLVAIASLAVSTSAHAAKGFKNHKGHKCHKKAKCYRGHAKHKKVRNHRGPARAKTTLADKTFSELRLNGASRLHKVVVENTLQANGKLFAYQCQMSKLLAHGKTVLLETTVQEAGTFSGKLIAINSAFHGDTNVKGSLFAKNTEFADITLAGNVVLQDAKVGNISITADKAKTVRLKGSSIISGDITFTSGNGIVVAENQEQVQGNIIGGVFEESAHIENPAPQKEVQEDVVEDIVEPATQDAPAEEVIAESIEVAPHDAQEASDEEETSVAVS